MTEKDLNLLEWIYDRMITVHGESNQLDYMLKFKSLINNQRDSPIYTIAVNFCKKGSDYCLFKEVSGGTETILSKKIKNRKKLLNEVDNLAKYFNANRIYSEEIL